MKCCLVGLIASLSAVGMNIPKEGLDFEFWDDWDFHIDIDSESDSPDINSSLGTPPDTPIGTPPDSPLAFPHEYNSFIDWQPCGELQCATILVPLNPADPFSRPIEIALNKYTSMKKPTAKTIILGPYLVGGSGTNFLEIFHSSLSNTFDDKFNFVGFDPRGAGNSEKLKCNNALVNGYSEVFNNFGINFIPKNADQNFKINYNILLKLTAEYCANVEDDLIEFLSTSIISRDLDVIRIKLGMEKLNYWGIGYGGIIGATFASIFPDKVGSVILDSLINPVTHYGKPFE